MIPYQEIPTHVISAFKKKLTDLGGDFKKQSSLCPETFVAHCLVFDRKDSNDVLTRLMILHEGHVYLHSHKTFSETIRVRELLGTKAFGNAYGHLLGPDYHISLDRLVDASHTFEPGKVHGINVVCGFVILEVTIRGEYNPFDLVR